nr:substrate-binding domain-containing protein [Microvirga massiliensis]
MSTLIVLASVLLAGAARARELRVCADPNNLPFSNAAGEGFENKIAALIAKDLGAALTYTWRAQRRGFLRETLHAGLCDLVPGLPSNMESVRTTRPYYRSTYAFVTREDGVQVASLNDPVLRDVVIGVQLIGDEGWNTPPAHALTRRGIVQNVRGYTLYGDYREPNPPARIVAAVAGREIDVAVVWGPLAGYFAPRQSTPLRVTPVKPLFDGPQLPMVWDISMAVRKEDETLRQEVDDSLSRHAREIDAILSEYGVPRVDRKAGRSG